jgi:hypothetical protein
MARRYLLILRSTGSLKIRGHLVGFRTLRHECSSICPVVVDGHDESRVKTAILSMKPTGGPCGRSRKSCGIGYSQFSISCAHVSSDSGRAHLLGVEARVNRSLSLCMARTHHVQKHWMTWSCAFRQNFFSSIISRSGLTKQKLRAFASPRLAGGYPSRDSTRGSSTCGSFILSP